MAKVQTYYHEKDILLSKEELQSYFKNTIFNYEKLKREKLLKPTRIDGKIYYKLIEILQSF